MKVVLEGNLREKIISAAAGVFETYGLTRISMQDISKAAKMGRTSLYHYFGNKMEVFDAVAEQFCRELFESTKTEVHADFSLAVNIEKYHRRKLAGIKKLVAQFHLVLNDLKQEPSVMLGKVRFMIANETALIHQVILWAMERKEIAQLNDADSRFLAETIVIAFRSFEQEMVIFDRFPDMEERLSWLSLIFCKGLK